MCSLSLIRSDWVVRVPKPPQCQHLQGKPKQPISAWIVVAEVGSVAVVAEVAIVAAAPASAAVVAAPASVVAFVEVWHFLPAAAETELGQLGRL